MCAGGFGRRTAEDLLVVVELGSSRITFTVRAWAAATTVVMSFWTWVVSPLRSRPMCKTMSISWRRL
jgi:hypothetical protein